MTTRTLYAVVAILGVGVVSEAASAQIKAHAPFTGAWQEGWEGLPGGFFPCYTDIFGGHADVCWSPATGQGMSTASGWSCACQAFPHGGGTLFGGAGSNPEFTFDEPVSRFGAYFTDICLQGGATAQFYDSGGVLLGSLPITVSGCQWTWNGWETGGAPIKRIRILGSAFDGLIIMDDCEADPEGGCYPDCDGQNGLTVQDFGCFQTRFVQGDPYADCDGQNGLTVQDFGCFQTKFVKGCPP